MVFLSRGAKKVLTVKFQSYFVEETTLESEENCMFYTAKYPVLPLLEHPAPDARTADEALLGEPLELLGTREDYVYVETFYHYTGWIPWHLLTPLQGDASDYAPVWAPFLDVYPAGDLKRPPVRTLTRGARVAPEELKGDFVALRGLGWCRKDALGSPVRGETLEERAVATARLYLGTPYRWGGRGPQGIDCSGLCFMAYALNGFLLWRDAKIPEGAPLKQIPFEEAKPGDLLYFPGHMALYLGEGRILHASLRAGGVAEEQLQDREDLRDALVAAARPVTEQNDNIFS